MDFSLTVKYFPFIVQGAVTTLQYGVVSVFLGFPLSILLAFGKTSEYKFFKILSKAYTSMFRGTPLLVQLSIFYLAVPSALGVSLSVFEAGIITFSLNSAAYSSEIIRSGIDSIDKGQKEAALVLGLSNLQTFRHIILPQAIRNILPALTNEIIALIKDSSIVSTFGVMDLYRRASIITSEKFLYFEPLLTAAFCYFTLIWIISILGKFMEKKLRTY